MIRKSKSLIITPWRSSPFTTIRICNRSIIKKVNFRIHAFAAGMFNDLKPHRHSPCQCSPTHQSQGPRGAYPEGDSPQFTSPGGGSILHHRDNRDSIETCPYLLAFVLKTGL